MPLAPSPCLPVAAPEAGGSSWRCQTGPRIPLLHLQSLHQHIFNLCRKTVSLRASLCNRPVGEGRRRKGGENAALFCASLGNLGGPSDSLGHGYGGVNYKCLCHHRLLQDKSKIEVFCASISPTSSLGVLDSSLHEGRGAATGTHKHWCCHSHTLLGLAHNTAQRAFFGFTSSIPEVRKHAGCVLGSAPGTRELT